PPAFTGLVRPVPLLVWRTEPVGRAGAVQRRDARATRGQRLASREVAISDAVERRAGAEHHEHAGLLVPPAVRRDLGVVAVQDSGLRERGGRGDAAPILL